MGERLGWRRKLQQRAGARLGPERRLQRLLLAAQGGRPSLLSHCSTGAVQAELGGAHSAQCTVHGQTAHSHTSAQTHELRGDRDARARQTGETRQEAFGIICYRPSAAQARGPPASQRMSLSLSLRLAGSAATHCAPHRAASPARSGRTSARSFRCSCRFPAGRELGEQPRQVCVLCLGAGGLLGWPQLTGMAHEEP